MHNRLFLTSLDPHTHSLGNNCTISKRRPEHLYVLVRSLHVRRLKQTPSGVTQRAPAPVNRPHPPTRLVTLCAICADLTIVICVVGAERPTFHRAETVPERVASNERVAGAEIQGEVVGRVRYCGWFVHGLVPAAVG